MIEREKRDTLPCPPPFIAVGCEYCEQGTDDCFCGDTAVGENIVLLNEYEYEGKA